MSPRSFRVKLALWFVGTLALTQVLFLGAMGWAVREALLRSLDRELDNKATQAVRDALRGNPRDVDPAWHNDLRRALWVRTGGTVPAWDPAGLATAGDGRRRYASAWVGAEHARILSVPWTKDGHRVGVMQVARPLAGLDQAWAWVLRAGLLLLPVSVLLAGAGGLFLTGRALRPVREVTEAAAEIGVEDLSRRLRVTGRDELATLAATFNEMIARLETAFEQQRRFTADAAHELRTPLSQVMLTTSLALNNAPNPEHDRQALRLADQAAHGMKRLVDQLLFLARADAEQLGGNLQPLEVGAWLADVLAEQQGVTLEPPPAGLQVQADPDLLIRVIANLVENARRHTPPDGSTTVAVAAADREVVVRVVDTGEGVPAEALPHLTERFYRVDRARSRREGGTGLGLAITASILAVHGGRLEFSATPGGGLTATVRLPRIAS